MQSCVVLFQEYLRLVCSEKEKAQVIMEKLQDRYAETVPEELQSYATLCQEFLHETEEKVSCLTIQMCVCR